MLYTTDHETLAYAYVSRFVCFVPDVDHADAPRLNGLMPLVVAGGPAAQHAACGPQAHWAMATDSPVFGRAGTLTGSATSPFR